MGFCCIMPLAKIMQKRTTSIKVNFHIFVRIRQSDELESLARIRHFHTLSNDNWQPTLFYFMDMLWKTR